MEPYRHMVQYYETDKMGITHHSNYIRWMEEARTDFLRQIGWPYEKLEEAGIFSPVTALSCKYRASTTFAENIDIRVSVAEFCGAVLKIRYKMTNAAGRTVFEGQSEHCFLNAGGSILRLKRDCPALHETLTALASDGAGEETDQTDGR